jgi:hypothetical protein
MVEGYDAGLVKKGAREIAAAVEAAAGGPVAAGDGGTGVGSDPGLDADAPLDEAEPQTWAGLAVTGRRS